MIRETSEENSTEAVKGHKPVRMSKALAFTPPRMDWEATNLPDELARFKQYCSLYLQNLKLIFLTRRGYPIFCSGLRDKG